MHFTQSGLSRFTQNTPSRFSHLFICSDRPNCSAYLPHPSQVVKVQHETSPGPPLARSLNWLPLCPHLLQMGVGNSPCQPPRAPAGVAIPSRGVFPQAVVPPSRMCQAQQGSTQLRSDRLPSRALLSQFWALGKSYLWELCRSCLIVSSCSCSLMLLMWPSLRLAALRTAMLQPWTSIGKNLTW